MAARMPLILLVGLVLLAGCGGKDMAPPPPGFTYSSEEVEAAFKDVEIPLVQVGDAGSPTGSATFQGAEDARLFVIVSAPSNVDRSWDTAKQMFMQVPLGIAVRRGNALAWFSYPGLDAEGTLKERIVDALESLPDRGAEILRLEE